MSFRCAFAVVALTITIGLPRFATHTPDSPYYLQLVRYFRGEVEREDLVAPYAYRVLTPFVAAQLPSRNLSANVAVVNVLCTVLAYLVFVRYLRRLLPSATDVNVGTLLLVVSFPTFAYSSRVLSDPAGFLALIAASLLLVEERPYAFSAVLSLGMLARDALILMIAVFLLWQTLDKGGARDKRHRLVSTLAIVPPLAVFLGVRRHFAGLLDVTGTPSLHQIWSNFMHPLRCASLLLTIGPPGLLWLAGWRQHRRTFLMTHPAREMRLPVVIMWIGGAFALYSIVGFVMGGRYAWPAYPGLIPLAVAAGRDTRLFTRYLAPAANTLFGK